MHRSGALHLGAHEDHKQCCNAARRVPDQAPMVSVGAEEPAAIVTKLRQALAAADRLATERAALEEALKARARLIRLLQPA